MLQKLKQEILNHKNPEKAELLQRFFKTGKGQYGEGDIFYGLMVPEQRKIAKKFKQLPLKDIQKLLNSKIHEERLIGLFILVHQYQKGDWEVRKSIVNFYLKNTKRVNNWDLVDLTAGKILGDYLREKDKVVLYKLAKSTNLWERRISIIATSNFIANNQYEDTLKISKILLNDKHDLIHKAVGWMLREIGKRDQDIEEIFLRRYHKTMPRTMLRYAIERFDEEKRKFYMSKT